MAADTETPLFPTRELLGEGDHVRDPETSVSPHLPQPDLCAET